MISSASSRYDESRMVAYIRGELGSEESQLGVISVEYGLSAIYTRS